MIWILAEQTQDRKSLRALGPGEIRGQQEPASTRSRRSHVKQHYDFSNAKPNPYGKQLAKQVTIRMDADTLAYFQDLATEFGIPHQTLVNMYLRECAGLGLRPVWLVKTVAMKTTSRTARPKRRAS